VVNDKDAQHIQPQLVVDSVQRDSIAAYHLGVMNIGSASIKDVRVAFTSSPLRSLGMIGDMTPVTATPPPHGGHVSVRGVDPKGLSDRRQLYAIFVFRLNVNGAFVDCMSSHHFVLPEGPLIPQTIDPQDFYESSGDLRSSAVAALRDDLGMTIARALSVERTGTITFWAAEKTPNGNPNYVMLRGSRLLLSYDPINYAVAFVLTESGETLTLPFEPKERHFVAVTWDGNGPLMLFVDGKKATRRTPR
jgi:hypothetical protein